MGVMGAKHAADDAVDFIQILNPLAFRRAESSMALDEEARSRLDCFPPRIPLHRARTTRPARASQSPACVRSVARA